MKFNTEAFLYNLLSTSAEVLAVVGSVDNILPQYPNVKSDIFPTPSIYFREINQPDGLSADDTAFAVQSFVDIQVFTAWNVSAGALARIVSELMRENLYTCTYSENFPDPEGSFQRRLMSFQRAFIETDLT